MGAAAARIISIHAAREGGDRKLRDRRRAGRISIHAAREGGDSLSLSKSTAGAAFQSTPPVKAATPQRRVRHPCCAISIHAAREGGDYCNYGNDRFGNISIHAAREGGDEHHGRALASAGIISIHAAREGGDRVGVLRSSNYKYFNPRRP